MRRDRRREAVRGRHASSGATDTAGPALDAALARGFDALAQLAIDGVQVSARAVDLTSGDVLLSIDDHVAMPTAGIGKVLLLVEVAARLQEDASYGLGLLERTPEDAVGGAGVWQHMLAPSLPVADLAVLVGASDNLATNVLLRSVGLDAVARRGVALGLSRTALLDLVRDRRGPDDAPQLSVGSAAELTWLFAALARGEIIAPEVSQRVISWLSLNTDLSMVASAFGLDPLAHRTAEHGILLVNKTGADPGVHSEAGVLRGPRAGVAYAVSTYFREENLQVRLRILDGMRSVGADLLEYVH